MTALICVCLWSILLWMRVHGSRGDQSEWYQACLQPCAQQCSPIQAEDANVLVWTCVDKCKYECMRSDVDRRRFLDLPMVQYYGKWPFICFFGMQEFFSVVFSLGNLYIQYSGFAKYQAVIRTSRKRPFNHWLIVMAFLSNCNGWIWSSVFHARDVKLTERLDYFSATWLVVFSTFGALVRVFWIDSVHAQAILIIPFILFYSMHISFLHFIRFDYSYNMIVTAAFGVLFNISWIVYSMINNKTYHLQKARKIALLFIMASCLELIDFPPIFDLIDAHALWHLATIPITMLWYEFLIEDARFLAQLSNMKSSKM